LLLRFASRSDWKVALLLDLIFRSECRRNLCIFRDDLWADDGVIDQATESKIVIFTSDDGGERFADTWPFIGGNGIARSWVAHTSVISPATDSARPDNRPGVDQHALVVYTERDRRHRMDPAYPSDGMSLLLMLFADCRAQAALALQDGRQRAPREGDFQFLRLVRREGAGHSQPARRLRLFGESRINPGTRHRSLTLF
jgi:hypothetical protein